MASERRLKQGAAACVAALMALAACAQAASPSPRLLVLCALAALPPVWGLRCCMRRLTLRLPRRDETNGEGWGQTGKRGLAPFSGTVQVGGGELPDLTPDRQAMLDAAVALDARLEHAPIALFRIAHLSGAGAVTPLNANARRLLAPGRASDPGQLFQLLAALPAERRELLAFDSERGVERALVAVTALTVLGEGQRMAALMPVESELEAEALNAWRQLVQVLTHEIMNSLTPVASLSRTAQDLLDEVKAGLPGDVSGDLSTALDAIGRRAASLVDFVASYRSLSTVPQAQPERVHLGDLFARLSALLAPQWRARGGRAVFSVEPPSLDVMVDPGQLEQALINLLKNAAEATAGIGHPEVQVSARLSRGGRLRIDVADNGAGVPAEMAAHIFTPFFSTKKQGRGIGLAMVRHLVHANGGTVRHAKPVSAGARFVVTF